MASRSLAFFRSGIKTLQARSYHTIPHKIGNREIVGGGMHSEPIYIDSTEFPMPAIRYKETTPDIQALRNKEKGDWKKLTIEDKRQLYRASFRQTFAEMEAPQGDWKMVFGITLMGVSISLWLVVLMKKYIYPPLPITFDAEHQHAQLERMQILNMQPITGLPKVE